MQWDDVVQGYSQPLWEVDGHLSFYHTSHQKYLDKGFWNISQTESHLPLLIDSRATELWLFWDLAPCNIVDIDRRFEEAVCLHHDGDEWWKQLHRPDDGCSKFLEIRPRVIIILVAVMHYNSMFVLPQIDGHRFTSKTGGRLVLFLKTKPEEKTPRSTYASALRQPQTPWNYQLRVRYRTIRANDSSSFCYGSQAPPLWLSSPSA